MALLNAILIGAGNRGTEAYGYYAQQNPNQLSITAIAEPNPQRRNTLGDMLGIPPTMRFSSWEDMPSKQVADCAIIATMDTQHTKPAIHFMEMGYHLLLEKPMAPNQSESILIVKTAERLEKKVMLAHVLRYSSFFSRLRSEMNQGTIGQIMAVEHKENIGYFHMAHSYVRGNWRRAEESAPILLAKSCHDLDLLCWLLGEKCVSIASFGMLSHFHRGNHPKGAADRCLNCAIEPTCPYSAKKIYLGTPEGWPVSVITDDLSEPGRIRALQEGPYGRCVYMCDNNVPDHQIVSMVFGADILVNMMMIGFTASNTRTIRVFGTRGEIRGHFEKNQIEVHQFGASQPEIISISPYQIGGHNGSDFQMMDSFVRYITQEDYQGIQTTPRDSLESHLMAFAAEESRKTGQVIHMPTFRNQQGISHDHPLL